MTAIAPNEAETRCLAVETSSNLDLILFVNDITPDDDTVAGDLTEPSLSGTGYTPRTITSGDWTITPGDPTDAEAAIEVWDALVVGTVPTVYGWALVERGTPDVIVRVERFAAPWTNNGSTPLAIRPRLTAS